MRKIQTCRRWETSPRSLTPHEGGLAPSHQGGLSSPKRSQHLNNQTSSKVGEVDRPTPQITYPVLARAWGLINDVEAFRAAETLLQKTAKLAAAIFRISKQTAFPPNWRHFRSLTPTGRRQRELTLPSVNMAPFRLRPLWKIGSLGLRYSPPLFSCP